ncbi:uncharacterized protein LOC105828224 [Monomorium pharaonis]|uniref:uncharacterized protein LOC105828224 n=1 Tax=Monomorium pharaonis TaxID=307658 RepID=UPI00063F192E|nr:uncharacterized protein LOC105828224 [Monomorium pharaonis]
MSAVVRVRTAHGNFIQCRALLDICATAHFVTEKFARTLKLPISPCEIPIGAIDGMSTASNGVVEFSFRSIHSDFHKKLSFLVVPEIAESIPGFPFLRQAIKLPANLKLADPQFHVPPPVDIIVGSGATLSLLSIGQINISRNNCDLFLKKTQLGWVVVGGVAPTDGTGVVSYKLTELTEQIAKFWLIEDTTAKKSESSENVECEFHYAQNTTRDSSGRYFVRLPFKQAKRDFGNIRSIALCRYYALQKRLTTNPILKREYDRITQEYIDLGHMSLVSDDSEGGYYLPHHAVMKSSNATTKVRVVFDASAKSNRGVSLNNTLMIGPTIQDKLFEHLVRFRNHNYVITSDIEKMYRQIWVHPDDRQFKKIFWHYENRVRTFQLNTVTFSISSALFLAIRTIQQLANDEESKFSIGAKILKCDLYVDDLLTGANTLEELIQIRDETINILKRGGFNIRQWASNHPQALEGLNERIIDVEFITNENPILKTLGIS